MNNTIIQTPGTPLNATPQQKARLRKSMRRRAAIEATICDLKRDHRLNRNYDKGIAGDHYNVLPAAAAANFARWMRKIVAYWFDFIRVCMSWRGFSRQDQTKFTNHITLDYFFVPIRSVVGGVFKG